MQFLATAAEMQGCDRAAIDQCGIPGLLLMENAGRAFTDQLEVLNGPLLKRRLLVIAGKGNNGGDGYVIARHALNRGASVTVALLARRKEIRGDALTNLNILLRISRLDRKNLTFVEIKTSPQLRRLTGAEIIVDAIFGTGFSGSASGLYRSAIEWVNSQQSFVASVDIASGVDATTGSVAGAAIRANATISMALGKVGQFVGAGRDASGKVSVVEIGIPAVVLRPSARPTFRVGGSDVVGSLPVRPLSAHKYSVGKVFVLAGSRTFTGAPALCSQGALVSGGGAAILGLPRSIHHVLASRLQEVIFLPLEETALGTVAVQAKKEIQEKVAWSDVFVIGPGLGRDGETDALIQLLLAEADRPCVIDADGLNAISGKTSILKKRRFPTIVTPHAGELSRLIGIDSATIEAQRVEVARQAARSLRSIVVLKGSPTVTAAPDGRVVVNSSGNPGMATIGAGDVLTGIIGGLVAQGQDPFAAAWSAVYLHGRAGDIAAARFGERSLVASDILANVSSAFLELGRVGRGVFSE